MRRWIAVSLVLVWTIIVAVAYYVYHKPFDGAQVVGVGATVGAAGTAALVALAGAGLGRAVLARFAILEESPPLERAALAGIAGLGLFSFLPLAAGLAGWLRAPVAWAVTLAVLGLTRRSVRAWFSDAREGARTMRPTTRAEWALAAFVALMLIVSLANALGPVVGWDALLYHLTGPKWDVAAGRASVPASIPVLGYSPGVEMLFAWAMLLGGDRAAAPVHWAFGVLLGALVWGWGRRWGTGRTAWLALAILLGTPSLVTLMGEPYIDMALLAYGAAGLAAVSRWRATDSDRWLALAGVLGGMAFGAKFTGGVVGGALGLVALQGSAGWRRGLRSLVIIGLAGVALAAPWLIKNWVLTGNPTYPFFFGGVGWDAWRSQWFNRPGTGLAYTAPWQLLAAPWLISIWGEEGRDLWHATLGPLWLLVLPMLPLTWRAWSPAARRWAKEALVFAGALYAVWLYGAAESLLAIQPRLLFPVLPPLAVLAALAWEGLAGLTLPQLSIQRVVGSVIGLALALTAWQTAARFVAEGPGLALMGAEPAENFLYRRLGWHYEAQKQINALPPGSKVIFLFEPRAYYCDPGRCVPDGILDRWWHARRLGGTAQSIAAEWRAAGTTHVLVFAQAETFLRQSRDPYEPSDWTELERLKGMLTVEQNFGEAYVLYRLR